MAKIPFDIKYRPQIESGEYIVIDRFNYELHFVKEEDGVFFFTVRYPGCNYDTERLYDHPENHLFIVIPEEDLSEFEKVVAKYRPQSDTKETIQRIASELLACARKEALKDLPRWREWGNGAAGNSDGHPIALVSGAGGIRFVSVLGITGEKYIMLDDLKKLPGFKED